MAWDGNGSFNVLETFLNSTTQQPRVIDAAAINAIFADFAKGLENCLTTSGETPLTANIPMAGNRFTGAGDAQAPDEYMTVKQVQNSFGSYVATTGTDNAYLANVSPLPGILDYTEGMRFLIKVNHTNTGAATVKVNQLAVKDLKRDGTDDLLEGDLQAGRIYEIIYDGVNFIVTAPSRVGDAFSGPDSELDADTVDGMEASDLTNADNLDAGTVSSERLSGSYDIDVTGNINASKLSEGTVPAARLQGQTYNITVSGNVTGTVGNVPVAELLNQDDLGPGKGLDADLLDNQHGDYYLNLANATGELAASKVTGTLSDDNMPDEISSDITGTSENANKFDNHPVTDFVMPEYLSWTPEISDGDGDVFGYIDGSYRAYRIGDLVTCIFEGYLDQSPSGNALAPYVNIPVDAWGSAGQHLGTAYATYVDDPDGSVEDETASFHGNMIARGDKAYFKTDQYDPVSGSFVDFRHLVFKFTYLAA